MIAPDSSVLIAGADPRHPFFDDAATALLEVRDSGVLIAHTLAETYSVLTGPTYRRPGHRVLEFLAQLLRRDPIGIPPESYPDALTELAAAGIAGGALYDGLIALGARRQHATLVSLDQRAAGTYRRCGIDFRLLLPEGAS